MSAPVGDDEEVLKILCPKCNGFSCYSEEWDAKFCPPCNMWLEAVCGTKSDEPMECWFQCWKRPEFPLPKKNLNV